MSNIVYFSSIAFLLGVGFGAFFGGKSSHNGDWGLIVVVAISVVISMIGIGYELFLLSHK